MARKPYQSSLMPYEGEIIALRRKRPPTPYVQIAQLLKEKYQITVTREGVFYFIKRRVKKVYKPCKYDEWDIELSEANNQPATGAKVIEKPTASKSPVPDKSEQNKPEQTEDDDDFEIPKFEDVMKYSETYNLTLMTPEEAAIMEEKIRRKKERDKLKAMQS